MRRRRDRSGSGRLVEIGYGKTRLEAVLMASNLSGAGYDPEAAFQVQGADPRGHYGGWSVRVPAFQADAASDHLQRLEERALLMQQEDPIAPPHPWRRWVDISLWVLILGVFAWLGAQWLWEGITQD